MPASTDPTPPSPPSPALRPSHHGRPHLARRAVLRWARRGALGLLAALVLGFVIRAFLPESIVVDTAAIARGPLEVTIEEDGRTRVRERYVVLAPLGGELDRIELEPGDPVAEGAALASIAPPPAALLDPDRRAEARARLAAAQARADQATTAARRALDVRDNAAREAARVRALFQGGALAAADRDRAELSERVAESDRRAAELQRQISAAEVETARAALGLVTARRASALPVRAPVAGRVLRVLRESGGPIAAGEPLIELGDPSSLEVVIDVLSVDAVRVVAGQPVRIERWGGERALLGRVARVEPAGFTRLSALGVEEQRVNVVVALAQPPAELGDGFRVEAEIVTWRDDDVLLAPASAVFRHGPGWAVFAVEGGRAAVRPVELGHRGRRAVEIRAGLAPGDEVVVYPGDRIRAGTRLAPHRAAAAAR
jgi:HlyD family secretion protein